ncbi:diaminopimelate epimerase [Alphaproteobacteria bacterium]|nr:diaminopimelate epimerase [Alphaproteobacteria bacterium]
MGIPFIKMHGLGNDFIIFDNIKDPIISDTTFLKRIGDRRFGVGCDQIMIIKNTAKKENYKIKIYNCDGTETGACGNGARCVADYIMKKENLNTISIETTSGNLECSLSDNGITVNMGIPKLDWQNIPLATQQDTSNVLLDEFKAYCLSMGNPHAVIFLSNLNELEDLDLTSIGPRLEKNPIFPKYSNIEFAHVIEEGVIRMRVWERGAGITLACGSGACATSVAASLLGLSSKDNKIILDGGNLYIKWLKDQSVTLSGDTEKVFEGILGN